MNRTITTQTTIPAPTGAVNVTADSGRPYIRRNSGTGFLTLFGEKEHLPDPRVYIFIPSTNELLRVEAVLSDDLIKVSANSTAAAAAAQKVFANVASYSITNTTSTPASVDGQTFPGNATQSSDRVDNYGIQQNEVLLPIRVDGSASPLFVVEQY